MSQAQNKYYPPDHDGKSTANQFTGTNPRKATVRFELPLAAKCHGCDSTIAPGVRFNATKTRAGSYLSTPIWRFSIKHVDCGHPILIETDPKNATYVAVEGATLRPVVKTEEAPSNPFEAVEREVKKQRAIKQEELVKDEQLDGSAGEPNAQAVWTFKSSKLSAEDLAKETQKTYDEHLYKAEQHQDLSYYMRQKFRHEKRKIEAQQRKDNILKDKMGLLRDMPLADDAQVIVPELDNGVMAKEELKLKCLTYGSFFDGPTNSKSLAHQTQDLSSKLQVKSRSRLKLRGVKKPGK